MRTLELNDILGKKYSIEDGKVVEKERGQYYTFKVAQCLAESGDKLNYREKSKLLDYDNSEFECDVLKFCDENREKMFQEGQTVNYEEKPIKEYEVFKLNSRIPRTILLRSDVLPLGRQRELFYDLDIANKVCENMESLEQYNYNEFDEGLPQSEITDIENQNEFLKRQDNELFEKDEKLYEALSGTSFISNYNYINEQNEKLISENKRLKSDLSDNNQKIIELTVRLQDALETIEDLNRPKNFFERFKDLFRVDKNRLLK